MGWPFSVRYEEQSGGSRMKGMVNKVEGGDALSLLC